MNFQEPVYGQSSSRSSSSCICSISLSSSSYRFFQAQVVPPRVAFFLAHFLLSREAVSFCVDLKSQAPSVSILIQHSYSRHETISLKSWLFIAYSHRMQRSKQHDLFSVLHRPWELQYFVFSMLSSKAFEFISARKRSYRSLFFHFLLQSFWHQLSSSTFPPQMATAKLASFPLGSISPQSNCKTVQISPFLILALVPPIFCQKEPTITSSALMLMSNLWEIYIATRQVIILVSEAISTAVLLLPDTMTLWLCMNSFLISAMPSCSYFLAALNLFSFGFLLLSASNTMQAKALTFQGGLKGFAQFLLTSLLVSRISLFSFYNFYWYFFCSSRRWLYLLLGETDILLLGETDILRMRVYSLSVASPSRLALPLTLSLQLAVLDISF